MFDVCLIDFVTYLLTALSNAENCFYRSANAIFGKVGRIAF